MPRKSKESGFSKAARGLAEWAASRPVRHAYVFVYNRPSGYWYANAYDAKDGKLIADATAHSRSGALAELRGKFAMIGVKIDSTTNTDPYT